MKDLIDAGEFTNRSEIISTAVRFWKEHRNIDEAIRNYLKSDEGRELIREIAKESRRRPKKDG